MTAAPGQDVTVAPGVVLRYGLEASRLPADLAAAVLPLGYDEAAQAFVARSLARPHGALRTALYLRLRTVLSDYDAYGLLGMYRMHLWSEAQLQALLAAVGAAPGGRLLDVGAGSGAITARSAQGFSEVVVTERSAVQRRALRARGYRVLDCDLGSAALPPEQAADVVTCLHVLDRTARPRSMLHHLGLALRPGGVLVLSLPLPLSPHVQGRGHTADPEESLPPAAEPFEAGVLALRDGLLAPAGLTLQVVSRLPYLCHGDAAAPLYVLDAAVVVCRPARPP